MYKRLLVTVLVSVFFFSLWGKTETVCQSLEVEDSVPVFQKDTLPVKGSLDFLRIKRIGRYDRGIMNYRFIPKGKWISGFTMSYWDYNSADNKLLFAYFDNFDCDGRNLNFSVYGGYAVCDNMVLGLKFGYRNMRGALNNITLKIDDDVDFSLKDLKLEQNLYNVSFFHRSYVGLDAGKRFGLFNETALTFNFGKSKFDRGVDENLVNTQTDIFEVQLGINPGLAVFIMQNVSIECSLGIAGIRYRQEKQKNNLGETGKRMTGGSNFRVNPFNISLGLTICL
ncbi:hypothetical protein AAHJ11_16455 [Bacteroides sp. 90-K9/2]|uniref:hypothetical protein n=1 Tax=Bacteroides sp. 90-K9/2 TaxID=3142453 RepID=UPI0039B4E2DF